MQGPSSSTRRPGSGVVRAAAVQFAAPSPVPVAVEKKTLEAQKIAVAESKEAENLRNLLTGLVSLVDEFKARRQPTIEEIAQLSVELGTAMAERLVATEIAANRQRLDRIVQQALDRLPPANRVTIRAHPDDIALLKRQLTDASDLQALRDTLSFQGDRTAQRGCLKLEAEDWFAEWNQVSALEELRTKVIEEVFAEE